MEPRRPLALTLQRSRGLAQKRAGDLRNFLPCSNPGLRQTRRSPETVLASRRSPPSGPCGPDVGNKRQELEKRQQMNFNWDIFSLVTLF